MTSDRGNAASRRLTKRATVRVAVAVAAAMTARQRVARGAYTLVWDPSGTPATPTDGGGIWSVPGKYWIAGSSDVAWPNYNDDVAQFGAGRGTAGTVYVSGALTTNGLVFAPTGSGNYTIAGGGSLKLDGYLPTVDVRAGVAPVVSAQITGTAGLVKVGSGQLTVSGTNTFTGGTRVNGGALVLGSLGALGGGGGLNISSGATVTAASDVNMTGSVFNGGSLTVNAGNTLAVGGTAPVFNQSAGTLAVNGALSLGTGAKFYDLGGTITGTVGLRDGGVYFGTAAAPGQFTFTTAPGASSLDATVYPVIVNGIRGVPGAGTSVAVAPTTGSATVHYGFVDNTASLSITAANGSSATLSLEGQAPALLNYGTFAVSANGTASAPIEVKGQIGNFEGGTIRVNTPLQVDGDFANDGTLVLAAPLTFDNPNEQFAMYGPVSNVSLSGGALFDLSNNYGGFTINGGTFGLQPFSFRRSVLKTKLVNWYPPQNANPGYPTTASIANVGDATGLLAGQLDMAGGATFNLAYDQAVLTVSTSIVNGTLTKTGPGTLVLAGANTYAGSTNVSAGTLTLAAGSSVATPVIQVAAGATLNVAASIPGTTIQGPGTVNFTAAGPAAVSAVSIAAGQVVTVDDAAAVKIGTLSIAGVPRSRIGLLDVGGGAVAVSAPGLFTVNDEVRQGFAAGRWNGSGGIASSVAAADAAHLTAVGVIQNATAIGGTTPIYTTFQGLSVDAADVLVRYTFYGDTNLDGLVTAADYTRMDAGFVQHLTGWQNGDLNYDGTVDGSDYALADNAFNRQAGVAVARPASAVAAVPEPAGVGLAVAVGVALRRRRRA